MKLCKTCGELKPYDATQKKGTKASGFNGLVCWTCHCAASTKAKVKAYATPEGKAKARASVDKYQATPEGKAKVNATAAKYLKTLEGRAKNNSAALVWAKNNPGKATAKTMKYYTSKLKRVPLWADLAAIQAIYMENAAAGLETDHFYSLRGKLVSGLHVHQNLQGLAKGPNCSKGNRHPYHPTENW